MVSNSQAVWFCYSIPCAAPQGVLSAWGWWVSLVFGRCCGWVDANGGFSSEIRWGKTDRGPVCAVVGAGLLWRAGVSSDKKLQTQGQAAGVCPDYHHSQSEAVRGKRLCRSHGVNNLGELRLTGRAAA